MSIFSAIAASFSKEPAPHSGTPWNLPTGYYWSLGTLTGERTLAFFCPGCRQQYIANAPHKIKHCGKTEKFYDNFLFRAFLPRKQYIVEGRHLLLS